MMGADAAYALGRPRDANADAAGREPALWTIEAWRGLAAWLVVWAHLQPLSGLDWPLLRFAYTGVDLFFALSGFVFAPYLHGARLAPGPFALRRLFRIYPAYVLALAVYVAMTWAEGGALSYLGAHLTFTHLQSREMAFYYNPAFWSLPAEVQYYLLLPLAAAWVQGRGARLAALGVGAVALRAVLGAVADPVQADAAFLALYQLPGVAVEFMAGVLAWRWAPRVAAAGRTARAGLAALGLAGWLGLATLFAALGDSGLNAGPLRGQISALAAVCFAVMLAATAIPPRRAPAALVRGALWAGQLSYGVYLLHGAALRWVTPRADALGPLATTLAVLALTLAGAWLLHRYWEEPWRRWGRRQAARLEGAPA